MLDVNAATQAEPADLRRDYARALDSIKGHIAYNKVLEQQLRELRAFQNMVNRHRPEFPADPEGIRDVWYWQGDGEDHLESMTHQLPVVIRAEQLRELLAAAEVPAPAAGRAEPVAQATQPAPFDVTLDEEQVKLLHDTIVIGDDADDLAPIRLVTGDGHSGYGLYLAQAEYQEEGAVLLAAMPKPTVPAPEGALAEAANKALAAYAHHESNKQAGLGVVSGPALHAAMDTLRAALAAPAPHCTRSHPHEDMSAECQALTVKARADNAAARAAPAPQAPVALTFDQAAAIFKDWRNGPLWLHMTREVERAHGIPAPQTKEPTDDR